MSDMLFEREMRTILDGLAPADVPRSLGERVAALGSGEPRPISWAKRVARAAFGATALLLVVAVGAVAFLRTGWDPSAAGPGGEPPALTWRTQMATLAADRLMIEAGGRAFTAPRQVDYVISDPGSATYRTLELAWDDEGTEMRVNIYLGADSRSWWVQHIRTYDGGDPGDWIYYLGPSFGTPLGESYVGNVDLYGVGMSGIGRLRIDGLTLRAFEAGTVPPAFDDCRAVGPAQAGPFGAPVGHPAHPDLSEYGIEEGMEASEVESELVSQGICHEFRLEFPSINRGQIWCTAPPGKVRQFAFGSSGQVIVFIEDATSLPLDTELAQVVSC